MPSLRRILERPRSEQIVLARALLVVTAVRLMLWVVPFRSVRARLTALRPAPTLPLEERSRVIPFLVRAVRSTSRVIPRATCLTQAIALQYLLVRVGAPGRIHIGVRRLAGGSFESHA